MQSSKMPRKLRLSSKKNWERKRRAKKAEVIIKNHTNTCMHA